MALTFHEIKRLKRVRRMISHTYVKHKRSYEEYFIELGRIQRHVWENNLVLIPDPSPGFSVVYTLGGIGEGPWLIEDRLGKDSRAWRIYRRSIDYQDKP